MAMVEITHAEQAGWQRRAARELAAILAAHPDLPVIGWTVTPAGSSLVGHVNGLALAGQAHRVFHIWRAALDLSEHREAASGIGTTYLHAAADRSRVRVRLTATVFDDQDG